MYILLSFSSFISDFSTMNLTKLENYFPKAEVRTLDRCNFRQPNAYEEFESDIEAVKKQIR